MVFLFFSLLIYYLNILLAIFLKVEPRKFFFHNFFFTLTSLLFLVHFTPKSFLTKWNCNTFRKFRRDLMWVQFVCTFRILSHFCCVTKRKYRLINQKIESKKAKKSQNNPKAKAYVYLNQTKNETEIKKAKKSATKK